MIPIDHLYVHIPFCPRVCPYCAFHALPAHRADGETLVRGLIAEHRSIADRLRPTTVFLGGGTPTALSIEMLRRLLRALLDASGGDEREASVECNPSTLSKQKARLLRDCGVNRLSIGAQSFDPAVLRTLGRAHSPTAVFRCVETAREAGFANINLDLMSGVPGQTLDSWKNALDTALSLKPQHLSCYALTYEDDTDFFLRHQRGEFRGDRNLERAMFHLADERLAGAGFVHYEISNYALPGFECHHNLAYWRGEDYLGIGPSAVSTVCGARRRNSRFAPEGWKVEHEENLPSETLAAERMALGLRTAEGVAEAAFAARFGFAPRERWPREIQMLIQGGLMRQEPPLRLTLRGREVADEIAVYFV